MVAAHKSILIPWLSLLTELWSILKFSEFMVDGLLLVLFVIASSSIWHD